LTPAPAQERKGSISCLVTDSGHGVLNGATVDLEPAGTPTVTDTQGQYTIADLAPGESVVTISYVGLDPLSQKVAVAAGHPTHADAELRVATQSDSITVAAERPHGEAEAINRERNKRITRLRLGFEAAYQQLGFLPGRLSGLGISANHSDTASRAYNVPGQADNPPLQRQAPHTWNIRPTYDRGRLSMRLGVSYNAANIFQYNYSDGTALGLKGPGYIYLYTHLQVDAQGSFRLAKGFSAVVYGLNLTNQVFGFYQGNPLSDPARVLSPDDRRLGCAGPRLPRRCRTQPASHRCHRICAASSGTSVPSLNGTTRGV
jgi:hypothetical protein